MLFNWQEKAKNQNAESLYSENLENSDSSDYVEKPTPVSQLANKITKKNLPSLPENLDELNGAFANFSIENIEFIDDFLFESMEFIALIEEKLLDLEKNFNDTEAINSIFRYIHTIKGSAGFMELTEIAVVSHWSETLLDKCRTNEFTVSTKIIDIILKAVDILKELLKNVQLKVKELRGEKKNIELKNISVSNILNLLRIIITDDSNFIEEASQSELENPNIESSSKSALKLNPSENILDNYENSASLVDNKNIENKKNVLLTTEKINQEPQKLIEKTDELQTDSIRIPINKIDSVYEMVGEVLISVSLLKQSAVSSKNPDKNIIEKINYLDMLTDQLQMKMLKIRMFPIKTVYDKLNRQVRDLIKKSGKSVDFTVFGGETEVDKIIIDEIFAPLTHTIRNSMDHGIESPEKRIEKGKNKTGIIKLTTENRGDNVIIEILDDGAGLNKEKIIEKAIENNLINAQDKLEDNEIYNLIFAPGFSTAAAVTEISGRGVGMDVVKKTIHKLGGKIDIETEVDKFTKFILTLPISTSIIDGLIVKAGKSKYIFPVLKVKQTIDAKSIEIKSTYDSSSKFIVCYNKTIPLFNLNEIYGKAQSLECGLQGLNGELKYKNNVIIIIEFENKLYGIAVDEILCKQKVVSKNLGDRFKDIPGLKGVAILGDGSVGMIIEPGEIVRENYEL